MQYATIPAVAAFLGLSTNYVGVKMLFYPIEYTGTDWFRSSPDVPYGVSGRYCSVFFQIHLLYIIYSLF